MQSSQKTASKAAPLSFRRFHFFKLSKSAVVGIVASLLDLVTLWFLVEFIAVLPTVANFFALILGALIQFVGNKYFTFYGEGKRALNHEILLFVLAEALSLGLNFYGFSFLLNTLGWHYLVTRILVTTTVFVGFSYPVWHFIFSRGRKA